jgi:hypothetical protein
MTPAERRSVRRQEAALTFEVEDRAAGFVPGFPPEGYSALIRYE